MSYNRRVAACFAALLLWCYRMNGVVDAVFDS